jgi:hypothetical protein
MTLAKKTFYLSSAVLLASAIGLAQAAMGGSSQEQDSSASAQAAGAALRGCLSGSAGNYTLTDHSGTIYHLVGGESQLQRSVGHEIEITGTPDAQRTGTSDDVAANTASSFQVTGAREVAARCDHGSRTGAMGTDSQPMTERPPSTDQQPKGAPGEGAPPQPEPHMMALLQQPASPDMGSQSSSSTSSATSSTDSQNPQNGSMANTPVTNQTPAEPASPTGANSQLGSGTTNPSAVGTQPAQSSATTTPQAGASNADAGGNAPSATKANPDMNAAPATTNPGASPSPQGAQNDQKKPLYERQATDVPWASHSGSTTTTTTPQTEPHL